MFIPRMTVKWMVITLGLVLLTSFLASCTTPAATAGAVTSSPELVTLQEKVAAQETRIAELQKQNDLAQLAASQATQIVGLETQVAEAEAKAGTAQVINPPTAIPPTPNPTATIIPAIADLPTQGNTKGLASAKVTITEYVDYF